MVDKKENGSDTGAKRTGLAVNPFEGLRRHINCIMHSKIGSFIMNKFILAVLLVCLGPHISPGQKRAYEMVGYNISTPLLFEENVGQVGNPEGETEDGLLFTMKANGVTLFFWKDGISYQWYKLLKGDQSISEATRAASDMGSGNFEDAGLTGIETFRMDMRWVGANTDVEILKEGPSVSYNNYYYASCPDGRTGTKSYQRITYKNIYDQTDITYYVKDGKLKYDVILHPGSSPENLQIAYDGNEDRWVEEGALVLSHPFGTLTEKRPVAWTKEGINVDVEYVLKPNSVGFSLGVSEIIKEETIIDPGIEWASYFGGTNSEYGRWITVDNIGNIYHVGYTVSLNAIALNGFQNTYGGGIMDAYLVKFDSAGVRQWATYFGGSNNDYAYSVDLDNNGNIFVAGYTNSSTAIASGGHQNTTDGILHDAFLVKFDSLGIRQWGTYFGGPGVDYGISVAVDLNGDVIMAGQTTTSSGIISGGFQNTYGGGAEDSYIVKFNGAGLHQWSTYYGGVGSEDSRWATLDGNGNIYLSGHTSSTTSIASGGFQNTYGGGELDAFLVKFNPAGARQWATYYGGPGKDFGYSVEIGKTGDIFLGGYTSSTSAMAYGGFQNIYGGGAYDAYLVKFDNSGARIWATYFGGIGDEIGYSTAIDGNGNVYLSGQTSSRDSIAFGGVQNVYGGGVYDAYLVKYNSLGTRQWSTYYGGPGYDDSRYAGTDTRGNVYLTGYTASTQEIASGGFQNAYGGGSYDAFVVKFGSKSLYQPTGLTFTNIGPSSLKVNYTAARDNPDGYLALMRENGSPTEVPVDGVEYTVGEAVGVSKVVYFGNAVSFDLGGLVVGTVYHFDIFSYNIVNGSFTYLTSMPLEGNVSPQNDRNDIVSFSFAEQLTGATIDTVSHTINIEVKYGTDITKLAPVISASGGASINPLSGELQDFSSPFQYTVTAENGTEQIWTISVMVEEDVLAPVVSDVIAPGVVLRGSGPATVSATVTDDYELTGVTMYYRGISSADWLVMETLQTNGDNYLFTLTEQMLDGVGLEFYIQATDASLNETVSDTYYIYSRDESENGIDVPGLPVDGGRVKDYIIVAFPFVVDDNRVSSILEDDLGPYDNRNWRFFSWSEGRFLEYGDGFSTIDLGKGYFFNQRGKGQINFTRASTPAVSKEAPYIWSLAPGWNLIGNPYNFELSWQDVIDNNPSVDLSIFKVYKSGYQNGERLTPFEGGFVYVEKAVDVVAPVKNAAQGGRLENDEYTFSGGQWKLFFDLEQKGLINKVGGIGMHPDALLQQDKMDEVRLPRFSDYVDINHEGFSVPLAMNIVETAEEYEWLFTVESSVRNGMVSMSWDNSWFGNSDKDLYLKDLESGVILNMREHNQFSFRATGANRFAVVYGSQDFIDEKLFGEVWLGNNYPNPLTNTTTIPFNLPKGKGKFNVELTIYDLMGREVDRLVNKTLEGGKYSIVWKSSDGLGKVKQGVYIYKLNVLGGSGSSVYSKKLIVN